MAADGTQLAGLGSGDDVTIKGPRFKTLLPDHLAHAGATSVRNRKKRALRASFRDMHKEPKTGKDKLKQACYERTGRGGQRLYNMKPPVPSKDVLLARLEEWLHEQDE